jgi:hypothetical protein
MLRVVAVVLGLLSPPISLAVAQDAPRAVIILRGI